MEEEWRDVVGYDAGYEISNLGRLKRIATPLVWKTKRKTYTVTRKEKIFKTKINRYGYERTALMRDGKHVNVYIARLVAIAFIPNPYNKPTINHIDCNKLNNKVDNLEWCTNQENFSHAQENGLLNTGPLSEEHKKKISIANKGKPSKLKGTHFTEEHKKRISIALKGIKHSREAIEKTRKKMIGRKASIEARLALSKAQTERWAAIRAAKAEQSA